MKYKNNFIKNVILLIGGDSIRSFAKKCGISEGSLRHYLKGTEPTLGILGKIAHASNVTVAWLVGEEEEPRQPASVGDEPQCSESIPFATSKHIMGCKKLSGETTGRKVLEAIIDLAENDPDRFIEVAGDVMKANRESKEKRSAKKNDLSRGQGESNTESQQSSTSLNIDNHKQKGNHT